MASKYDLDWLPDNFRLDLVSPSFETSGASIEEDQLRSRKMLELTTVSDSAISAFTSADELASLARRLRLTSASPSTTLASSRCMRSLRLSRVGAMLELFDHYADSDLTAFTVMNRRWVLSPNELMDVTAATIRDQFRRHLVRAGHFRGPVVAFLHGEYEPIAGVFVQHFHGITLKANRRLLNSLSGRWGYERTSSGAAPVKCKPIRNRVKQFSYSIKAYWPERVVIVGEDAVHRERKPRRIREPYHSLALLWLDHQSSSDIQLLINCRMGAGGRLVARYCT